MTGEIIYGSLKDLTRKRQDDVALTPGAVNLLLTAKRRNPSPGIYPLARI